MQAFHLTQCTLAFRPDEYVGGTDLSGLLSACDDALGGTDDEAFRQALIRGLRRWLWQSNLGLDFLIL